MSPYAPSSEIIAERIRLCRKTQNLTQEQLATAAGIPAHQLARIERAELEKPAFHDVWNLCQALVIDPAVLLNEDPNLLVRTLSSQEVGRSAPNFVTRLEAVKEIRSLSDNLFLEASEEWLDERLNVGIIGSGANRYLSLALNLLAAEIPVFSVGELDPIRAGAEILGIQNSSLSELNRFLNLEPKAYGAAQLEDSMLEAYLNLIGYQQGIWCQLPFTSLTEALKALESPTSLKAANLQVLVEVSDEVKGAWQFMEDVKGKLAPISLFAREDTGLIKTQERLRTSAPRKPAVNGLVSIDDPLRPPPGIIPLGDIQVGEHSKTVGFPVAGLNTHAYLCGTTGSGKSVCLEWIAYGLANAHQAVVLLDPHGSLSDHLAASITRAAPERSKDIMLINLGDPEQAVAFNPLFITDEEQIESRAGALKEMLLKMLNLNPDSAPRAVVYAELAMWALLEANYRALADHPELSLTLPQLTDFFTDPEFRRLVTSFTTNLSALNLYGAEGPYEKLGERQQLDMVMPIIRTFASLASKESFANSAGQSLNKLDFKKWIREKKVVLIKLPPAASQHATSMALGSLMIPMMREAVSQLEDSSAYLIVDELQNFAASTYKELLASSRKEKLRLIGANQIPQDLPPDVLRGVQVNAQTKISFRLDSRSAEEVADFIASGRDHPTPSDILELYNYHGYANLMLEGGRASGPVKFRGLPPMVEEFNPAEAKAIEAQTMRELAVSKAEAWKNRQEHMKKVKTLMQGKLKELK